MAAAGFGATLVAGLAGDFVAALATIFSVMVVVIAMTREAITTFDCRFFVMGEILWR